ncbi:Metallo-hydrolase/oxidoreductase [Viridothelium virens]|uniref:Metallo-hydrolase/oxidoreductase n=1 Tax=Viridothelium virens TaxID=1048519 RepID=A0A6A6H4N5_VIRVR|nr:Metallo-hydrolase/oxidoreductase [Viridothelium virens]
MLSSTYLVEPTPAPPLNIPKSDATVSVSIIDSTTWIEMPMYPFFEPDVPGKTQLTCPAYSFLITNGSSKRKILFDLGVPKDWTNMAPKIVNMIQKAGWSVTVEKNVSDILIENDIPLTDVEAIVWSHHHWDHIGDPSTFPSSTSVIVGPGFKQTYTPGYPTNPDSVLRDSDFTNRSLIELSFSPNPLKIGRFDAFDYFGDGSFYLLSTPGHTIGHLCGLARTTPSPPPSSTSTSTPPTFIFMAGDACHLGGEFRPTSYLPLPTTLHLHPHSQPSTRLSPSPCPGTAFQRLHRCHLDATASATQPFYTVTRHLAHDLAQANWTIDGLKEFDAAPEVLVVLAHDEWLRGVLDFFPRRLDAWWERGWGEEVRWRFLGDFETGLEGEGEGEGEERLERETGKL